MSKRSCSLSPIDHAFTGDFGYPVHFVLRYSRLEFKKLYSAFEKVLPLFYPLASGLVQCEESKYQLEERFLPSDLFREESLKVDLSNEDLDNYAKLCKTLKSTPGQKLFDAILWQGPRYSYLAVSISHCVVDGYSYFWFLNTWSNMAKGLPVIAPLHARDGLGPTTLVTETVSKALLGEKTGFVLGEKRDFGTDPVKRVAFQFTNEELAARRTDWSMKGQIDFSDNDIIVGWMLEKGISMGMKEIYFAWPIDFRRLHKSAPENYFGNAVRLKQIHWDETQLGSTSVIDLTKEVRSATRRLRRNDIFESLDYLDAYRRQNGLSSMENLHVVHPQKGMLVTNLSKVPLSEIDFGQSPPDLIRSGLASNKVAAVFPTKNGIEIQTCV